MWHLCKHFQGLVSCHCLWKSFSGMCINSCNHCIHLHVENASIVAGDDRPSIRPSSRQDDPYRAQSRAEYGHYGYDRRDDEHYRYKLEPDVRDRYRDRQSWNNQWLNDG